MNALKWARSEGYPAPNKPYPKWLLFLGITGLLAGGLPKIVIFGWMAWRTGKCKDQERQLIMRWVDKGRPQPD